MHKALKYLKPYWLAVVAVFALVFGQVQCELALPDYMSNIVTYGIQYSGVTDPVPDALSKETYDHMQYFMSKDEIATLKDSYEQSDQATINGKEYATNSEVYVRKENADASLADAIKIPFLTVQMFSSEETASEIGITNPDQIWLMLEQNPEAANTVLAKANEMMANYTEENISSAQIMLLKNEYQSIGIPLESLQNAYILKEGGIMLAIALLGSVCAISAAFLSAKVATGAARSLRRDVFAKVESFSSEEFTRFSTASLITRTTNDVQQVQMILTMMLRIVLFAPMMGLTAFLKVLAYPELTGILGWTILLMIVCMFVVFCIAMPRFRKSQKLVDRLNLVTREQLSGMLVIRAFNNEDKEEKRFDQVNTDITKLNIFLNRLMTVISPLMTFLMSAVSILIIWIGSQSIDAGTMQIGDMMAFLQYSTQVLMSFMIVAAIFIMIPRASVSADRIFEILETKPTIEDPKEPKTIAPGNHTVAFNHVYFRYPHAEKDVLEDINFTAEPGETVAFIGSTGSGKSTLINLLPRFFDVTKGSITLNGVDIRDLKQHDLRDRIGYIPQKGVLFSGTIESNLRYANEYAENDVIDNALTVSQSKEFVEAMPKGIQEPIAEGGTNVSGGQKQRLSIARALTKEANIYIFDDTFSALDYATDAKLRSALQKMIQKTHSTIFIVAQRISTIRHADKIIVLDDGHVAGMGTHDELMQNCSVYQEIARSQLNEEELAK